MTSLDAPAPWSFLEFFAGVGMAGLGLGPRWRCAFANDHDPRKLDMYAHHFGDAHLDGRDVAEVARSLSAQDDPSLLARLSGGEEGAKGARMAWASFPCQDLSLAGWRQGMSAARSGAYWPFWQILAELHRDHRRPPVVVLENVVGMLDPETFEGLCESLVALDMRVGALLADASAFVPQSRPRVFVVAVDRRVALEGLTETSPQHAWHGPAVQRAMTALPPSLRCAWAWWRVAPLPELRPVSIDDVMEARPADVMTHDEAATARLLSLMTDRHREKVATAAALGGRQIGFLYRRTRNGQQRAEVRFDGVAGCLRTPRGGSSRQTVMIVEGDAVSTRLLSGVEAARLMGMEVDDRGHLAASGRPLFPADFSYNDGYKAMGDGVAVPVVRHLARGLLDELASRSEALGATMTGEERAATRLQRRVSRRAQAWSDARD